MSESMYWLWRNGDDFLIFPTRHPADENGDPKVYGEPAAGPLSLYEAQCYMERAICDAPYLHGPDQSQTALFGAVMRMSLKAYQSRAQRASMRGALSDAAHLCDALAVEIGKNNPGRRKGSVSSVGLALQSVAKSCGDAIWAMREKVSVPDE